MKQVFEQYASVIISMLIAVFVLAVITEGDFGSRNGIESSIDNYVRNENKAYDTYMSSAAPSIQLKNYYLVENKKVLLSDCFQAQSNNGDSLTVYLKGAWSLAGEETDLGLSTDGTSICVPEAGVYWVQVYAVDDDKKETCVQMKLLVNER